ncbi:response regulator transcription factor [Leifsonia sp. NPDC077715]|uniref:response regulator transcription factor n=1 Tax=Leifsonia sp. NPDC077715 TaxID=3155539 RepID=UPI00342DD3BB
MRVLIVDDEEIFAEAVRQGLASEGVAADCVFDGTTALEYLSVTEYDLVILDRDLPGIHGDEVCAEASLLYPDRRILMLTAADTTAHKVSGFAAGADDYLVKPFEFPELVARVRALARRRTVARPVVLTHADLSLDTFRRQASRWGRPVRLGRKEFAVLELLLEADGGIVTAETMLEKAWDINTDPFTSTIRVTLSNLRKKLGAPDAIETIPGVGYRLADATANR